MALTLYGGLRSRASMPRWYMAERGIAYSWTVLDLEAGEHRAEPFTAINPFGKVPALVDEDPALPGGRLQLFESGAILLYGIPRVVIGENRSFMGEEKLLAERGVKLTVLQDERCIALMRDFMQKHPQLWAEDIGE
jgi:glutathione S-transferase